jgi:hypothetical protein
MSHFNGIYKNMCKNRFKHNYNNYWSNKEIFWSCIALVGIIAVAHLLQKMMTTAIPLMTWRRANNVDLSRLS